MSDGQLTVNFINYSPVAWTADQHGWDLNHPHSSAITQQPQDTLQANSGFETLAYAQNSFGGVGTMEATIWWCWNDGKERFGVKLHIPMEVLGIGKRPYWYYMHDSDLNSSDIDWTEQTDPSEPYTWPSDIGYDISVQPTADSDTLTLNVTLKAEAADK